MKKIIALFVLIISCTSCVNNTGKLRRELDKYQEYFIVTEILLDSLYEMDYNHDLCWQDTIMETEEYEKYERSRTKINQLCLQ